MFNCYVRLPECTQKLEKKTQRRTYLFGVPNYHLCQIWQKHIGTFQQGFLSKPVQTSTMFTDMFGMTAWTLDKTLRLAKWWVTAGAKLITSWHLKIPWSYQWNILLSTNKNQKQRQHLGCLKSLYTSCEVLAICCHTAATFLPWTPLIFTAKYGRIRQLRHYAALNKKTLSHTLENQAMFKPNTPKIYKYLACIQLHLHTNIYIHPPS